MYLQTFNFSLQAFQKYLLYKKDHSELLYYILRQLAQDQLTFIRGTNSSDGLVIEINEDDLKDKVRVFFNFYCSIHLFVLCFRRNNWISTI